MTHVSLSNKVYTCIEDKLTSNFCDMTMSYKQWYSNFLLTVDWIRELQNTLKYLPHEVDSFKKVGDCWVFDTELGEFYAVPIMFGSNSEYIIRVIEAKFINKGRFSSLFENKQNKQYTTMNTTKKKKIVKLTESDLRGIIKQCINEALNELDWKTYANAAKKRKEQGKFDNEFKLLKQSGEEFIKNHGMETDGAIRKEIGLGGKSDDIEAVAIKQRNIDSLPIYYHNTKKGDTIKDGGFGSSYYKLPTDKDEFFGERAMEVYSDDNGKKYAHHYFEPNTQFRQQFDKAAKEVDHYNNGDYEYQKGKGWQLKNGGLDESIRRSIRKAIRNL